MGVRHCGVRRAALGVEDRRGNYDGWAAAELIAAIDPNREMDGEDLCAHLGVEESDVEDDDYMAAFIEGAQDVFTEVENQI